MACFISSLPISFRNRHLKRSLSRRNVAIKWSATARPLRPGTLATVLPVLATRKQTARHFGTRDAILDRCFTAFLTTLTLFLVRSLFLTPLYHIFTFVSLSIPLLIPFFRATRRNAYMRRYAQAILLSGRLSARRSGGGMQVILEGGDGHTASCVVPYDGRLLQTASDKIVSAHALIVGKGVVVDIYVPSLDRFLVDESTARRDKLSEICRVVDTNVELGRQ